MKKSTGTTEHLHRSKKVQLSDGANAREVRATDAQHASALQDEENHARPRRYFEWSQMFFLPPLMAMTR